MRSAKTLQTYLFAFFLILLLFYTWNERWRLPCLLGQQSETSVGHHSVRIAACWYEMLPLENSVFLFEYKLHPFGQRGQIYMRSMPELGPDFLDLIQKSKVFKRYPWGTVVRLEKNWLYRLLKTEPSPEMLRHPSKIEVETFFIREKKILVEASQESDLDSITSIRSDDASPSRTR